MEQYYDPLWDENGELRRGCTVCEALVWLTRFGSHSAGEDVCITTACATRWGRCSMVRTGLLWRKK